MGCCMSSNANSRRHPSRHSAPKPADLPQRSPPQPSEEETVKEVVISETPPPPPPHRNPTCTTLNPIFHRPKTLILEEPPKSQTQQVPVFQEQKVPIFQQPITQKDEIFMEKEETKLPAAEVLEDHRIQQQAEILCKQKQNERKIERTPEVSETYSNADTYSTATTNTTTTITEIRDDNSEVTSKRRIVSRSPSKLPRKRPYNPERDRISKRQPVKREYSGQSRTTSTSTQRGGNVGSSRVGRDVGERSIRRSRSPATRGAAGGGVKGRAGVSPAKVTGKSGGGGREEESEVKKEEKSENDSVSKMQEQGQQQQQGNESLENPVVSLECFIFL